ncbi:MAG: hypothetical protein NUW37_16990 [Planctomycetes bacterium]|nr:hypothetical protein [Planctomycetota bacterium]
MNTQPNSKGMSLDDFIARKLQPVRVTINLLSRELDLHEGDLIPVHRQDLVAVISTLEIFVEEYERVSNAKLGYLKGNKKNYVDAAKPVKAIG